MAPYKYEKLKLGPYLENAISGIKGKMEKSTPKLKNITLKIKGILDRTKPLYDLQPRLDYWYYTKFLGYGDEYKADDASINKVITDGKIINVDNPKEAVLIYIYIRSLSACDPSKYGRFKKYISHLRHIAQADATLYAYFLTHLILYDTYFGQKHAPPTALEALKELQGFCKDDLKYEREHVDLMAEIIICCRLCRAYDFPFYSRLVESILSTETFLHYHENAALVGATFDWEQEP